MDKLLSALADVDFQWTTHIDTIWHDVPSDIPELQTSARGELFARLAALKRIKVDASPLGIALLGTGGSGKTHLLSALRRAAFEHEAYFVLVDMTDVRDFWGTVLLGYIRSLEQRRNETSQFEIFLRRLLRSLGEGMPSIEELSSARPPKLINRSNLVVRRLASRHRSEMREYQDVLRALILLASDDFELQDHGYQWLQGLRLDDDEKFRHGFAETEKSHEHIVRGLSWLMSLDAPTVLALDQLDAIVAEHNLASASPERAEATERQKASLAIIQSIAGGLSALRDVTRRTLTVVSSLEATWNILDQRAPVTMKDRFEPPLLLQPIRDARFIRNLIERRLAHAYAEHDATPPYASYPFSSAFFERRLGALPREVLKACFEHRRGCLTAGRISEIGGKSTSLPPESLSFEQIERRFAELSAGLDVRSLLERQDEDALDKLLEAGCEALIEENPTPEDVDVLIDKDFQGTGSFEPLHVRLRVVRHDENDREVHYAFRFLEKTHHIAFQSRLKAAMTSAGIDRELGFRRLAILRAAPLPRGPLSERLLRELADGGGLVLNPDESELSALAALRELFATQGQSAALTREWLRKHRPISKLALFRDAVTFLFGPEPHAASAPAQAPTHAVAAVPEQPVAQAPMPPVAAAPARLPLGRRLVAGEAGEPFQISLDNLTKHAVVLAGAGSGKTVLLRRMIEEAALAGVPSIVIDGANDLSRLGDAWPEPPSSFDAIEREKASRYYEKAEVVVWSPGREKGNPLRLQPLPDFASVLGDADELNAAIDMARSSLEPIALATKTDKIRQGVLSVVLRYFAAQGGGTLARLVELLREPPPDVTSYEKGEKIAHEAAERLLAETEVNPLFRGGGKDLDPGLLLQASAPDKVRISVINLTGLNGEAAQQQFLNQLSMTLFSWVKKHPARGRSLQGLLVIDEARDFVPNQKSVPGKDNLIRLVAQARKYGLGMVFATQAPKSIDHRVIANCSTQFYGRQNSPAAIDTVREQLVQRGASGNDVAKLPKGVFYAFTEGLAAAQKVAMPLCLSYHPPSPPDEREILERAKRSRASLG